MKFRYGNPLRCLAFAWLLPLVVHAADGAFAGKWRGELKVSPPARGATTGTPGTDGATAPEAAPPSTPSAGGRGGGGFGGGRGGFGGGGFGGGGFPGGGFAAGPQKVALNLKESKDGKISGNITFGEGNADDVKEGRVTGNTITFKAGRAPQPVYEYFGELKENQLVLTRTAVGGRGAPQQIVLTKK